MTRRIFTLIFTTLVFLTVLQTTEVHAVSPTQGIDLSHLPSIYGENFNYPITLSLTEPIDGEVQWLVGISDFCNNSNLSGMMSGTTYHGILDTTRFEIQHPYCTNYRIIAKAFVDGAWVINEKPIQLISNDLTVEMIGPTTVNVGQSYTYNPIPTNPSHCDQFYQDLTIYQGGYIYQHPPYPVFNVITPGEYVAQWLVTCRYGDTIEGTITSLNITAVMGIPPPDLPYDLYLPITRN